MKKFWIGLTAIVLVMGIGAAGAYAQTSDSNGVDSFFEKMLPFAKQMHPDLTDQQIKEMYDSCHKGQGAGGRGMMNSSWRGGMMNF